MKAGKGLENWNLDGAGPLMTDPPPSVDLVCMSLSSSPSFMAMQVQTFWDGFLSHKIDYPNNLQILTHPLQLENSLTPKQAGTERIFFF